ncbi:MAG: phosphate acyltransferase, partial [Hellea sp.]|nr:phosphate acyltransferase [Hellea sp.]
MRADLTISIDAMGGDNAPEIVIKGVEYYLRHEGKNRNVRFLLHGDKGILSRLLKKAQLTRNCSDIIHTEKLIEMDAKPSQALRRGKD